MKTKSRVKLSLPPIGAQYARQSADKGIAQVKNPVTRDQATTQIRSAIEQSGMQPQGFVELGKLCEDAINNPKKNYSKLVDFMVTNKMETRESLKKPDWQMISLMVVFGRVAEEMVKEG